MLGRMEKMKEVEKEERWVWFWVGLGMIESFCGWKMWFKENWLDLLMRWMKVDLMWEFWMRMRLVMFVVEVKLL